MKFWDDEYKKIEAYDQLIMQKRGKKL
jgi:hypothetical protein